MPPGPSRSPTGPFSDIPMRQVPPASSVLPRPRSPRRECQRHTLPRPPQQTPPCSRDAARRTCNRRHGVGNSPGATALANSSRGGWDCGPLYTDMMAVRRAGRRSARCWRSRAGREVAVGVDDQGPPEPVAVEVVQRFAGPPRVAPLRGRGVPPSLPFWSRPTPPMGRNAGKCRVPGRFGGPCPSGGRCGG